MALRPPSEDDLATVGRWNEGARRQSFVGRGLSLDRGSHLAITLREDGGSIGVVGYRVGAPEDGWLGFGSVVVEPRWRGMGLEEEAVRLVEEDALARGPARRFWAEVDRDDGPALYFWLRLGYRPTRPDESPWQGERPSGIMSMVRLGRTPGGRP